MGTKDTLRKKNLKAELMEKQGGVCCYCERPFYLGRSNHSFGATFEHLKRKIDGGKSNKDNLALAHRSCNMARGDMDWLTYKSMRLGEIPYE